MKKFIYDKEFVSESGARLPSLEIAYHTYGELNDSRDNVIWVCHALTANSDVKAWWPGMVGEGLALDTSRYFIVCANIPASCYGSTGPLSINEESGEPWFLDFPMLTIRDVVNVLELLRQHLGIRRIDTVIGASVGGQQALEYAIMYPDITDRLVFIASNARQSPWAVAFNESQRLAIEADPSFRIRNIYGGREGLKAARSIALLSYRNHLTYNRTQAENGEDPLCDFRAASYQAYQGDKLVRRFNVWSYYRLTQMTDSHNVGRGRGGLKAALARIEADVLCVGISSDLLFPVDELKLVAGTVARGRYVEIDSDNGHDGFLIEAWKLTAVLKPFLSAAKTVLQ